MSVKDVDFEFCCCWTYDGQTSETAAKPSGLGARLGPRSLDHCLAMFFIVLGGDSRVELAEG